MSYTTFNSPAPDHGLTMAIARELVSLIKDYLGRGPTKARAVIRDDVVVVIMQDTLTKAETTLASRGLSHTVHDIRRNFQETMREDASAIIERLTGRRVISFMSDHDVANDVASEVFVLEPDRAGEFR